VSINFRYTPRTRPLSTQLAGPLSISAPSEHESPTGREILLNDETPDNAISRDELCEKDGSAAQAAGVLLVKLGQRRKIFVPVRARQLYDLFSGCYCRKSERRTSLAMVRSRSRARGAAPRNPKLEKPIEVSGLPVGKFKPGEQFEDFAQ
jgi:hypothetical protein